MSIKILNNKIMKTSKRETTLQNNQYFKKKTSILVNILIFDMYHTIY